MTNRTVSVNLLLRNNAFIAGLRESGAAVKRFTGQVLDETKKNKVQLDDVANGFASVGLAAGAAFVVAVKHFADFDQAMSKVRAATHETAGNMAALRDAALDAGAKTAFSATEAAGAIENLAKAGVATKDILGGGLKGALDLASAGELAVGDAAEIAATAMTQFKLSGKDVPHIADLLAAAAGKAQGEVSDVAQALKQGGLVASQFGLSIEETTGTLAAFASAGLLGSDAGTSFKTMLLRLANPAADAAAEMKKLGIAAYDTKGNFVGIAPLAEQLQAKLSKLTPAQRDAALATIFGSDAIRAANVLYQNGAKGIAEWTTKVNDQGYAAETAALKTDNLKGDIERLGGALDTALIKGGSGANDTLRAITQTLDNAVTGFSELPSWVQQGATAIAGLAAVGGLGAAGIIKTTQAVADLREAWSGLSKTGRGLSLAAGGVGIALLAATAIYGAFAKKNAEAKQRVEDLRGTLDEQTGAITGNTRAYVSNQLAQSGMLASAKGIGLALTTVTDAALGNEAALKKVVAQLDAVIEAGKTQTNTGKSGIITTYTDSANAAKKLKDELTGMNSSLTDAQSTTRLASEASAQHKSAEELATEATRKANEAIQEKVQSLQDDIAAMHKASNAALELSGSHIAVQAAIDDATASLKENGRTLDIGTEKGRANRTALNELAGSANRQTDAMLKAGESNRKAGQAALGARASFVKIAMQMGLSKKEADALAKSLIDLPPTAKTTVSTPGAKGSKTDVDGLNTSLNNLPKSKTVNVTTNMYKNLIETHTVKPIGVLAPGRAAGGILPGSPSASDNMIIKAASGEFVVNSRQNKKHRGLLEAINSGLDGFATGGLVGGGKLVDPAYLLRQLNTPFNPLAGINFSGTLAALNRANAAAAPARANAVRAEAAESAAKARVAQLQRAITLQQRYVAQLRAQGASEAEIRREQKETIGLQDQLYAARGRVTAATKASAAADAVYRTKADAAAKAAAAHRDSIERLIAVQEAAVQLAQQVASGLTGAVDIGTLFRGSGENLLAGLQQQGAGLESFRKLIDQLRARKLSEDLIGQIVGKGAGQGSVLAQAILDQGLSYIAALNAAQKNLQNQANLIGAGAANAQYGVKVSGARAAGGYVAPYSNYLVGETGRPEILRMGSQAGWVAPTQIDANRFMRSSYGASGGTTIVRLDARDLQTIAQAVSRVDVRLDEGRLTRLIDVRAGELDDRQAREFQVGRR
ncbi:hypothetical protein GCM10009745_24490 [Kribbella yunnanensis]|uniref:Phage tail tape measure protein domain-containing protein n=1 Tax=Kribbella yunnanensis TaxID=190194 RepID=A0ABP4SZA7_9ACTN